MNFLFLGPPDPNKTQLLKQSSIVVCTLDLRYTLAIEPRDEFENFCHFNDPAAALKGYSVKISKVTWSSSLWLLAH